MEKIVKAGLRDCTVNLDGSECAVKFDSCFRAFAVRNDGAADVFISKTSGIVPDDDGVMCVKSGASAVFAHMDIYADTVYLLGNGRVQVHAQNDSANPFNYAPTFDGGVQASGNPVVMDNLQEGIPFSEITVRGDDIIGHDLTVNVSGKNLIPYPYSSSSEAYNGVTFTVNSNGTLTLNGTANAQINYILTTYKYKAGIKYTISGCPSGGSHSTYKIKAIGNGKIGDDLGTSTTFSVSDDIDSYIVIIIYAGTVCDNLVFKPQLELGDTATAYEPYHGSTTTITPDSNPYVLSNDIRQQEGLNVVGVSEGEISVTGVRKNAALKKLWDEIDEIKTAIIVSNGESE